MDEKESPIIACRKWYQKQFWRYENNKGGMNALIEKSSGKLIGHCGLLVQTVDGKWELEIGYSLLPEISGIKDMHLKRHHVAGILDFKTISQPR